MSQSRRELRLRHRLAAFMPRGHLVCSAIPDNPALRLKGEARKGMQVPNGSGPSPQVA